MKNTESTILQRKKTDLFHIDPRTIVVKEKQYMQIGNIVKPTEESRFVLRSGAEWYEDAVVICIEPFILTSKDSTMKWQTTIKKEDFEIVGEADKVTLDKCMRRLQFTKVNKSNISGGNWAVRFLGGEDTGDNDFFVEAPNLNKPELGYGIGILMDDYGNHNGYPREQRLADAKAISAIPEMIEALQLVIGSMSLEKTERFDLLKKCRQALLKAEQLKL